jgi:hypothetical protein
VSGGPHLHVYGGPAGGGPPCDPPLERLLRHTEAAADQAGWDQPSALILVTTALTAHVVPEVGLAELAALAEAGEVGVTDATTARELTGPWRAVGYLCEAWTTETGSLADTKAWLSGYRPGDVAAGLGGHRVETRLLVAMEAGGTHWQLERRRGGPVTLACRPQQWHEHTARLLGYGQELPVLLTRILAQLPG